MTRASEWLVEMGAIIDGQQTTLRYSTCGYTSAPTDTPANTYYPARITDPGGIDRRIWAGGTTGAFEADIGDIALGNNDGALDDLIEHAVDGQPIVVKRLDHPRQALADAETMLTSVVRNIDASAAGDTADAEIRIVFYDRMVELDEPLLTARYGGTTTAGGGGTADGTEDMEGQIKPHVWGKALNVQAVLASPFDVVLQFSADAVDGIGLADGGVPLINDGDEASLADLIASDDNPVHYRTYLAGGMARPAGSVQGRAAFVWTADVTEGATAPERTAAAVVERMLAHKGYDSGDIDSTAFDALVIAAPQEVGILVDSETSALSSIRQVLDSVGGYLIVDTQGRFTVGRLAGPGTPVGVIGERDIIGDAFGLELNPDTDTGLPAWRVQLRWGRFWKVHSETELGGYISETDPSRAGALRKEWRETAVEDTAISDLHPLAKDLQFDTLMVNRGEAETETLRRFNLYSVDRYMTEVTVTRETAASMPLNSTVTLQLDRAGLVSGRDMVVIGRSEQYGPETVTLRLWG